MFRSGTVVGGSPTVSSGVPSSSRTCGQKGGCQMGVGVFQPSEMEVVMSEHRFVITGRLWQSIAPLLPDKATDRGVTADRTIQLRTTTPPWRPPKCWRLNGCPASQLQLSNLLLAGSSLLPNEVAWVKIGRSSFATCGRAVSDEERAGDGQT